MKLAIFDLDNTLIAGDSDHAWGEFLVAQGLVDGVWYKAQNDKFYADYCTGQLDIIAYSEFVFGFLAQHDMSYLQQLHQQFMAQVIQPIMLPKAQALIQQHRATGDFLLIITATNRFITQPIGEALGISELLATEPQQQVGRYTGKVEGVPCYKEGKITRYQAWLAAKNMRFEQVYFYSDSHNDLPLLKIVDTPIAVDPDDTLKQYAQQQNWPILSLRD
ncbi:MAG: HAD family hydrolase [Moraxellaceae bacterium]|nr:HAD family hydrolase [Moraxellaceae bacterium]